MPDQTDCQCGTCCAIRRARGRAPFDPRPGSEPTVTDPNARPVDPDCRDGKHGSCVGGPCGCACHATSDADRDARSGRLLAGITADAVEAGEYDPPGDSDQAFSAHTEAPPAEDPCGRATPHAPHRWQAAGAGHDCPGKPDGNYGVVDDGYGSTLWRCGPDCDLHVVRPGRFQCNGADDAITSQDGEVMFCLVRTLRCPDWPADDDGEAPAADPEALYRVTVDVPARIGSALIDSLFTAVADAVHEWEPDERDDWDAVVSGSVTDDDEPVEAVAAAFNAGPRGTTGPPPGRTHTLDLTAATPPAGADETRAAIAREFLAFHGVEGEPTVGEAGIADGLAHRLMDRVGVSLLAELEQMREFAKNMQGGYQAASQSADFFRDHLVALLELPTRPADDELIGLTRDLIRAARMRAERAEASLREQQSTINELSAELAHAREGNANGQRAMDELRERERELSSAYETAKDQRDEARMWARHGYEIGQRSCTWSDHGVAPAWLLDSRNGGE